jgi:hypothetical protein
VGHRSRRYAMVALIAGTKYTGGEDLLGGGDPIRGVDGD